MFSGQDFILAVLRFVIGEPLLAALHLHAGQDGDMGGTHSFEQFD